MLGILFPMKFGKLLAQCVLVYLDSSSIINSSLGSKIKGFKKSNRL
jgi:hypothetical protein